MKKVFLDANVFLDGLLGRTADFRYAEELLDTVAFKIVSAYTSSSVLLTVMYFLKKAGWSASDITTAVNDTLRVMSLVSPTEITFRRGLYAGFADLEDAVQYHTALQAPSLDYFITNNKKDFKAATQMLPVLTPKEFLAL